MTTSSGWTLSQKICLFVVYDDTITLFVKLVKTPRGIIDKLLLNLANKYVKSYWNEEETVMQKFVVLFLMVATGNDLGTRVFQIMISRLLGRRAHLRRLPPAYAILSLL